MTVSAATYQGLMDRPVRREGRRALWQCHLPGCTDGDSPLKWSCTGYPDGRWYCFSCAGWGSVVDLAVRKSIGRCSPPKTKLDPADSALKKAYWDQLHNAEFASIVGDLRSTEEYEPTGRAFDTTEQAFLKGVAQLMHRDLQHDSQALSYLAARGSEPLDCFGVARDRQMREIRALAADFNEHDLPDRCGITSRHKDYVGRMHFLLQDAIVTFNIAPGGVNYYQARTIRTDRDKRFYDPAGIAKRPIIFGSGPLVAAEGVYKVSWTVPFGFSFMAILGQAPEKYPASHFAALNHHLYLADRDRLKKGVRAGVRAARIIRNKIELTFTPGGTLHVRMPPEPYKDPDDWALGIGLSAAAYQLYAAFDQIRVSDPLFVG